MSDVQEKHDLIGEQGPHTWAVSPAWDDTRTCESFIPSESRTPNGSVACAVCGYSERRHDG